MEKPDENVSGRDARGAMLPYLLICVAPVVWGLSGVLVRWAGLPGKEHIIIFWRSSFALAFFFMVILVARDVRLFRPGESPVLLVSSGLATAA